MIVSYTTLFFLGIALAWTAVNKSGVIPFDWYVSLVFIGAGALAYWSQDRRNTAPPLPAWVRTAMILAGLYILFQLVPLPLPLLGILSPARAELARALAPVVGSQPFAPLSVAPPAHLLWCLTLFGCLAAFFTVRELAFRFATKPGLILLPLLGVAAFEAILGLLQVARGAVQATGTYNGRDHYVCLLEIVLPVTITYGMVVYERRNMAGSNSVFSAIGAAIIWLLAAIQLFAILASLSRAGMLDTLIALLALALLILIPQLPSGRWKGAVLAALVVGVLVILVYSSPKALLERLADTDTQSEGRFWIWQEALPLQREFAFFGTGLMGFDPTFLKYQAIVNSKRIDFAHNDYLQYLIELGIIGFVPLMAAVVGVLWPIVSGSWAARRMEKRLLLVGCTASALALALHSFFDFNLYVPANVLAFAWVLGFGSVYVPSNPRKPTAL